VLTEHEKQVYQKAIDKWGQALQLVMVLEETSELQKEVCKVIRGDRTIGRMSNIAEEIADVELTLSNLKYMLNLDENVSVMREYKLTRLESKL
jgi:hypothetical protein